jgi:hypothetical protein
MIETHKTAELALQKRLNSKLDDVTYNLNRKEYMLQKLENVNVELEKIILERGKEDKWRKNRLKLMGIEDDS